jgi:hypothetical protein
VLELNNFPWALQPFGQCTRLPVGCAGCVIGGIDRQDLCLFGHLLANGESETQGGAPTITSDGKKILFTFGNNGYLFGPLATDFFNQILQGSFTMFI